jgi:hypothetical protein
MAFSLCGGRKKKREGGREHFSASSYKDTNHIRLGLYPYELM